MTKATNRYQVMPPLSESEYEALKADIAERGVLQPVVFDALGNIIDGHHRQRAIKELEAEGCEIPLGRTGTVAQGLETDQQKRDLAWSLNMQRRHLDRAQKREAVEAKLKETPNYSDRWIAELIGVDHKTVRSHRIRLESTGEIPRYKRTVGKDGREYARDIRGEYVDEAEHRAKLEESKKKRRIRDILKGQRSSEDEETGGFLSYYGATTDEAIARHMGVTPGFVANERKELEERGSTLGEALGALPDAPTPLVKEEQERRAEKARHTKARKDEGYKSQDDHKKVLRAIKDLAHSLRMSHRTAAYKPEHFITPEDAVEAYASPDVFKSTSLYYTGATTLSGVEQGRLGLERAEKVAELFARAAGRELPKHQDERELTFEQVALLEEIAMFLRLGDWIARFGSLLAEKAAKDIEVAGRALGEKDRIAQEMEEQDQQEQGNVTPLTSAKRTKSS